MSDADDVAARHPNIPQETFEGLDRRRMTPTQIIGNSADESTARMFTRLILCDLCELPLLEHSWLEVTDNGTVGCSVMEGRP